MSCHMKNKFDGSIFKTDYLKINYHISEQYLCKIFSEKIMLLVILAIVSILDCDQFKNYIGTGKLSKRNPTEWSDGLSVPVVDDKSLSLWTIDHITKLINWLKFVIFDMTCTTCPSYRMYIIWTISDCNRYYTTCIELSWYEINIKLFIANVIDSQFILNLSSWPRAQ